MVKPLQRYWLLILLPLLAACSRDALTPEAEIEQLLSEAEKAVESRSVSAVKPFLWEQYRDSDGRDRRAALRLLTGYFLSHQSIHLLSQVTEISLKGEQEAEITLFVALAGQPIDSSAQLLSVRADLIRLDLELVNRNGEWQVSAARWRRANKTDFLK